MRFVEEETVDFSCANVYSSHYVSITVSKLKIFGPFPKVLKLPRASTSDPSPPWKIPKPTMTTRKIIPPPYQTPATNGSVPNTLRQ